MRIRILAALIRHFRLIIRKINKGAELTWIPFVSPKKKTRNSSCSVSYLKLPFIIKTKKKINNRNNWPDKTVKILLILLNYLPSFLLSTRIQALFNYFVQQQLVIKSKTKLILIIPKQLDSFYCSQLVLYVFTRRIKNLLCLNLKLVLSLTFFVAAYHGVPVEAAKIPMSPQTEIVLGPLQNSALVDDSTGKSHSRSHHGRLVLRLHRESLLLQSLGQDQHPQQEQQELVQRRHLWR